MKATLLGILFYPLTLLLFRPFGYCWDWLAGGWGRCEGEEIT